MVLSDPSSKNVDNLLLIVLVAEMRATRSARCSFRVWQAASTTTDRHSSHAAAADGLLTVSTVSSLCESGRAGKLKLISLLKI